MMVNPEIHLSSILRGEATKFPLPKQHQEMMNHQLGIQAMPTQPEGPSNGKNNYQHYTWNTNFHALQISAGATSLILKRIYLFVYECMYTGTTHMPGVPWSWSYM